MKKMKIRYPQPINSDTFDLGTAGAASDRALVESIVLTSEICGHVLSPGAAKMLAHDLAEFDETAILGALARCRMELQGRLKVSDILVRINDGRPDADEAWATMPMNEQVSVVWTEEMAHAWGVALPLLEAGDFAGARSAFSDAYRKAVLKARARREPVRWTPSLGSETAGRESVLLDAVKKGRLSAEQVEQLLPPGEAVVAEEGGAPRNLRNLH